MANTLKKMGHFVALTDSPVSEHFDIALINHLSPNDFNASFKIYTSHGVLSDKDVPKPGANVYVGVSEETQKRYPIITKVIRNPIDTKHFRPISTPNNRLTNILILSNNPGNKRQKLLEAVNGFAVRIVGGATRVNDPLEIINWSDLVVTLGRGCYEGLACGRRVLIHDWSGGDGLVDYDNIFDFRTHNCSGRYNSYDWSPDEIRYILEQYRPLDMRQYVLEEHNPYHIAAEYVQLATLGGVFDER